MKDELSRTEEVLVEVSNHIVEKLNDEVEQINKKSAKFALNKAYNKRFYDK
jgi:hypothetical protein